MSTIPYHPTELVPTVRVVNIELVSPEAIEIQVLRAIIADLNAPPPEYQEFATT